MLLLRQIILWYRSLGQTALYLLLTLSLLLPNLILLCSPYLTWAEGWANVLFSLGVYLCLLSLTRRPGKVFLVALGPLLLINAFQLVLFSVFKGEVIAVDMLLNLFSSSGDEAGELLSGLVLPIAAVLLLHVVIVMLALKSWRGTGRSLRSRKRGALYGLVCLVLSAPLLAVAHTRNAGYTLRGGLYPLNVFYNMSVAAGKLRQVVNYYETSRGFVYEAQSLYPEETEVYVFVLGETARAYSWQLNGYERETNPNLVRRGDQVVSFGDLTTQSNTTYKSVPILLSPADAENANRLPYVKGILTAFKEAGFHTVYISNQPENRSFLDFFAHEADEHYRIRDILRAEETLVQRPKPIYDTDMLPFLSEALAGRRQKLFVILHTYGSHWDYHDRYPRTAAYFKPDDALGANKLERHKLVNAYDNATRFTDHLLEQVIRMLEKQDATTAMYYTSDHGEDIFDDERARILHSSPSVSYYQLHVPGVLWFSERYRANRAEVAQAAIANADLPISSRSNLHLLLTLAGISTRELKPALSPLSRQYTVPEYRSYLNDRYECVPLSEMLTAPQDLEMWEKLGLGK